MPVSHPTHFGLRYVLALLLTCSLALIALPVSATPITTSSQRAANNQPFVTLSSNAVSVPVDGSFAYRAEIVIDRPTSYLEARLQIRNPGGSLLFQKTEPRNDVTTGTVTIDFARELAEFDLVPAAYSVELRVRSDAGGEIREWVLDDELLLYDPQTSPVPLALVVHVCATPSYDSEGRFVIDPGQVDIAREQVDALAAYILQRPDVSMTLALPPMLAEEWARIASGYETSGPEGVAVVEADSDVPVRYAETLTRLKAALDTGRLELATVPYADPDIAGLAQSDGVRDLGDHLERGLSATLAGLETSSSAGLATSEGLLPAEALAVVRARDLRYAFISQRLDTSAETTLPSGAYEITSEGMSDAFVGLVTDDTIAEELRSASGAQLVRSVFDRSISDTPTAPVVTVVDVGPGRKATVGDLRDCLDSLITAPWVEFVTGQQAAESTPAGVLALPAESSLRSAAPNGYWAEVKRARDLAVAFMESVGVNDPEVQYASDASLVAQSRSWAGPDSAWGSADRGLGFASAATRVASGVLDSISVTAQDITLSSAQGDVPITVSNASEKNLLLTLRMTARGIALPEGNEVKLTARPQDNFMTVPVDLQSSLSGDLSIEIWAGDMLLDSTNVTVRATFLDRLVLVGTIAIVLVGLLLFIRHRARASASVGTIAKEER